MAPWFDSWHALDETDGGVFVNAGGVDTSEGKFGVAMENADPMDVAGEPVSIEANSQTEDMSVGEERQSIEAAGPDVTDADIEAAVQTARTRQSQCAEWPHSAITDGPSDDEIFDDIDAMAAIEGNGRNTATVIKNPPPLSDEEAGSLLTDDATLLLDGFISDHKDSNGYALLSDVAYAAISTDLLVPPPNKGQPDSYLKQLLDGDRRFEIVRIESGDRESEFIRRL